MVDIEDVAKCHIAALESSQASGRYLCTSETLSWQQTCQIIQYVCNFCFVLNNFREKFPKYPCPTQYEATYPFSITCNFLPKMDNGKAKDELGINFKPISHTVVETCENLIKYGYVPKL